MNLLILGGFFGVGLLALIGLVALVITEKRPQADARSTHEASQEESPSEAGEQEAPDDSELQAPVELEIPVLEEQPADALSTPLTTSVIAPEYPLALMNGQGREFSLQLRTLLQQAQELEQRLSVLVAVVERYERSTSAPARVTVNEEEQTLPRVTSVR